MKLRALALLTLLALILPGGAGFAQPKQAKPTRQRFDITREHMEYIDNGVIRLGADMDLGGAITYLADARNKENIINNYDWGRQVQLSFYSGPVPYEPDGKKAHPSWTFIGWNPIQVGDAYGHRARVLEFKNDGRTLYSKSIPMHWPLDNVPGECTFESWVTLEQNAVRLRARINNNRLDDKTQYPGRGQEQPAVYTNGPLYRLVTYAGDKPFSGDAVTTLPTANGAGFPWHNWVATERWAALVREDGWGLGVYSPEAFVFGGGFSGKVGQGGSLDAPTGYITPWQQEVLDYNIQYEYQCVLIVGKLGQIRQWVYDHAERPRPPRYVFASDRQHWHFANARDAGWPVRGELNVDISGRDPYLVGPAGFWQAQDAPRLFITAAYDVKAPGQAQVFWRRQAGGAAGAKPRRANFEEPLSFDIIPDGQYHTYEVDLSASPQYRGAITGLRFDPIAAGRPGDRVRIKAIGFVK